jgi:outer membrane protein TolC
MTLMVWREAGTTGTGSIALLAMVAASGCMMVGPDYQRPPAPTAPGWITRDAAGIAPPSEPIGPWWESFGDPILTNLIVEAYRQNPSLQAAGVRVLEAQARRGIAIGTLFPQIQNAVAH